MIKKFISEILIEIRLIIIAWFLGIIVKLVPKNRLESENLLKAILEYASKNIDEKDSLIIIQK